MPDRGNHSEREARHGQKMIEVKVRFWTDNLANDGKIQPGHAWASGVVRLASNGAHGIKGGEAIPFNSLMGAIPAIEKALIGAGIQPSVDTQNRPLIDT